MTQFVRIPVGADPWDYKPGYRARQQARAIKAEEKTPEQIAATKKLEADFIANAGWNKPVTSAQAKIADSEARVAVEGDTDMNHDNVEAAE